MSKSSATQTPRSTHEPIWAPLETLTAMLDDWARRHPRLMELRTIGQSREGRALFAAILSDKDADDADKEHVVVTATHAGVERNCAATIFAVMEWLLDQGPLAREVLRRQKIVCVPMPNPDGYLNGEHGKALHSGWSHEGPIDPQGNPEGMALKRIFDEFQPEVLVDNHGISLDSEAIYMIEKAGCSPSNSSLRPYHHEIIQMMSEAAIAEGFPQDQLSSDSERLHWGPALDQIKEKLWRGRPSMRASMYCYARYHTITAINEISWEQSALAKHKCLFDIRNKIWPGYYDYGYPTLIVAGKEHHVMAYGQDAASRRKSRVELWNKQGRFTIGRADPQIHGKLLFTVATTRQAGQRWLQESEIDAFVRGLAANEFIDSEPIMQFVENWPVGQNVSYPRVEIKDKPDDRSQDEEPIRHGISFRLRIPSDKARLIDVRVNGKPIQSSEVDGYRTWTAKAFTYIQINIPPQRSAREDLFVVTCDYDPGIVPGHWSSWYRFAEGH